MVVLENSFIKLIAFLAFCIIGLASLYKGIIWLTTPSVFESPPTILPIEKVFVKGFEDSKGIVQLINLILHINKTIDTIYLYVNTNAYGYSLVDECSKNSNLFVRPVDLRVIYGNYFDDIRNSFNSINSSTSAICLTGLYKYT